ncbi:MAG TPA: DegT/DnrJ/EryC1/StrS family aminotransferase [Gammaproteobacteria bacterium]|nr:DegT/DnrJ/EryC1/StrS family aminotransferase [Gammaproteobacteria bacterium]
MTAPPAPTEVIPLFKVFMAPPAAVMPRLQEVLYSGQIGEGEAVAAFERRFGEFLGNPRVLSCSSGTAALHLALLLAGVGPGDEVVSTAMTAEPTNLAIRHAGATPRWADVDPMTGNVTGESVAAALSPRTRAILVVHYGGIPAPLDAIHAVAARHGLPVIEDAAHALGARWRGRPIGTLSPFTMFSLQAIKHLTTVDGGMLALADESLLPRGRRLRWFGIDRAASRTDVDVAEVGFKYHMNNVNATLGLVQIEHVAPMIARHVANGRWFDAAFDALARSGSGVERCRVAAEAEPAYWFYTLLCDDAEGLSRHLDAHGIGNSKAHKRNDRHSVFAASRVELPGLDRFYARMLHLPCGWWVDEAARERIVDVVRRGW